MVDFPLAEGRTDRAPMRAPIELDRLSTWNRIDTSLAASIRTLAPACLAGNPFLQSAYSTWKVIDSAHPNTAALRLLPARHEPSRAAVPPLAPTPTLQLLLSRIVESVCAPLAITTGAIVADDGGTTPLTVVTDGPGSGALPPSSTDLLRSVIPPGTDLRRPVEVGLPGADTASKLHACVVASGPACAAGIIVETNANRRLTATERGMIQLAARLAGVAIDHARSGRLVHAEWQWLETALGLNGEAIIARDLTDRVLHINATGRGLLGIDLDAPVGHIDESRVIAAFDLRDQWDQQVAPQALPYHRAQRGLPDTDLIISARLAAGQPRRWVLLHAHGVTDARGEVALVISVLRDFSVIQRRDASHHLRTRMARHLRAHPIDISAIEHELSVFVEGSCRIALYPPADDWSSVSPERMALRPASEAAGCDAARELRLVDGHLHFSRGLAAAARAHPGGAPTHVACIPILASGHTLGQMMCRRIRALPGFDEEDLELLTEISGQIGLAIEVARLRISLETGERLLVNISRQVESAAEDERRRMALNIHDGLAQVAASVCQELEILAHRFSPATDDESAELERARALAHRTVREARMLIAGLRPATLEASGLGPAVLEEIDQLRAEGWRVRYVDDVSGARYLPDVELALYRVAQEALSNIREHAGGAQVDVLLCPLGNTLRLEVHDGGPGFDPASVSATSSQHIGLGGMRERVERLGGSVAVDTQVGKGTHVVATVPI